MTAASSLSPASAGIFAALNVPELLAVAPGGVVDVIPQGAPTLPVVLVEVEEWPIGTMGARPGRPRSFQVDVRLTVYSAYAGMLEAQAVMTAALELLATPPPAGGFESWGLVHDDTVKVGPDVLAGVPVQMLAANLRLFLTSEAGS